MIAEERIVYLEVTSWVGVSYGAQHYYGKLFQNSSVVSRSVELTRILTAHAAAELNKDSFFDYGYKAGSVYRGFDTKQDIIDLALNVYKQHFPGADILILGEHYTVDPQPVLDGPDDFKTTVNQMVAEWKIAGGYEGDEKRCNQLYREYRKLLKEYGE